jgi:hypothetical protein
MHESMHGPRLQAILGNLGLGKEKLRELRPIFEIKKEFIKAVPESEERPRNRRRK